jgi:hypothetical protein
MQKGLEMQRLIGGECVEKFKDTFQGLKVFKRKITKVSSDS